MISFCFNSSRLLKYDILLSPECAARNTILFLLGGKIDYEKVSNIILNDFRTGKIGKITLEKINEE